MRFDDFTAALNEAGWRDLAAPHVAAIDTSPECVDENAQSVHVAPSITPLRSVVDEPDSSGHQVES